MSIPSITSTIFSTLGNNVSSIVPVAIKDIVSSAGTVHYFSKNGDKEHDGREKFIDEYGTEAIWLLGIPATKAIYNKFAKLSGNKSVNIDPRNLNEDYINWAKKYAAEKQKDILESAQNNLKKAKTLSSLRFFTTTAMTISALVGLILYKQKGTEEKVKEKVHKQELARLELMREKMKQTKSYMMFTSNPAKNKKNNSVSFKGTGEVITNAFATNPMLNQILLDFGITGARVSTHRDGELGEILLKEGTLIGMIYAGGKIIQTGLEKLSLAFGLPIDLDIRVLDSNSLAKSFKNNKLENDIDTFVKLTEGFDFKNLTVEQKTTILNFVKRNKGNIIVKAAKNSGYIPMEKTKGIFFGLFGKKYTGKIDYTKYIDIGEIAGLKDKFEMLLKYSEGKDLDSFLKKLKYTKRASILLNIGLSCLTLGVLQPLLILKYRKEKTGSSKNPAVVAYEKELKTSFKGKWA